MKRILVFLFFALTLLNCRNSENEENTISISKDFKKIDCPESWKEYKPTKEELEFSISNGVIEKRVNDSLIQQILYGRVWFEMINPIEVSEGGGECYLKNYRIDGSLDSEGYGIYAEHPIADFSMDGLWKFYYCDGSLKEEVEFENGKRLKK